MPVSGSSKGSAGGRWQTPVEYLVPGKGRPNSDTCGPARVPEATPSSRGTSAAPRSAWKALFRPTSAAPSRPTVTSPTLPLSAHTSSASAAKPSIVIPLAANLRALNDLRTAAAASRPPNCAEKSMDDILFAINLSFASQGQTSMPRRLRVTGASGLPPATPPIPRH